MGRALIAPEAIELVEEHGSVVMVHEPVDILATRRQCEIEASTCHSQVLEWNPPGRLFLLLARATADLLDGARREPDAPPQRLFGRRSGEPGR